MKIFGKELSDTSRRESALIGIPVLLVVAAAFWLAYQFVKPAPPSTLVMTTGAPDGAYHGFALRYQTALAKEGITLELRPSAGSVENLKRLRDETNGIELGFIQGGINEGRTTEEVSLMALASLYHEPLWVFYRATSAAEKPLTQLRDLAEKRINIGAQGSGTRKVALDLLFANGMTEKTTPLSDLGSRDAANALREGMVDAAFFVVSPESPLIGGLLRAPGIRLMSFAQADAYTRRFPFLDQVALARGVVDLGADLPGEDVVLLAPTANLVARDDLHPALAYLLMEVASEIHGGGSYFAKPGQFPSLANLDFPLADESKRYVKTGRPFLQRYLPFWMANLVERLAVMLVPIVAVLIPLFKVLPWLWSWRMRSRIYRWYGELKFLERDLAQSAAAATPADADALARHLLRLDEIEAQANQLPMPLSFVDRVYTLRQHIDMVRARLLGMPGPTRNAP